MGKISSFYLSLICEQWVKSHKFLLRKTDENELRTVYASRWPCALTISSWHIFNINLCAKCFSVSTKFELEQQDAPHRHANQEYIIYVLCRVCGSALWMLQTLMTKWKNQNQ